MMRGILPRNTIDGETGSPKVSKTSNKGSMPVQLIVPENSVIKIPVLSESPASIKGGL
jgi:hypothetical protein